MYRVPMGAAACGIPTKFLTGFYYKPGHFPWGLLALLPRDRRRRIEEKLERRRLAEMDPAIVIQVSGPLPELCYGWFKDYRIGNAIHDRLVVRWLSSHVAAGSAGVFHGFQESCCAQPLLRARPRPDRHAGIDIAAVHYAAGLGRIPAPGRALGGPQPALGRAAGRVEAGAIPCRAIGLRRGLPDRAWCRARAHLPHAAGRRCGALPPRRGAAPARPLPRALRRPYVGAQGRASPDRRLAGRGPPGGGAGLRRRGQGQIHPRPRGPAAGGHPLSGLRAQCPAARDLSECGCLRLSVAGRRRGLCHL